MRNFHAYLGCLGMAIGLVSCEKEDLPHQEDPLTSADLTVETCSTIDFEQFSVPWPYVFTVEETSYTENGVSIVSGPGGTYDVEEFDIVNLQDWDGVTCTGKNFFSFNPRNSFLIKFPANQSKVIVTVGDGGGTDIDDITIVAFSGYNGDGDVIDEDEVQLKAGVNCGSLTVEGAGINSVLVSGTQPNTWALNNFGIDSIQYCGDSSTASDSDTDGIPDDIDNCPSISNPLQEDNDNDGIGDICDEDDDNDGISDESDNCPFTANPQQDDYDGDGIGDICDEDDDNDGVPDDEDVNPFSSLEPTVTIDGCDTQVSNETFEDGMTLSDYFENMVPENYDNYGRYKKALAQLLEELVAEGLITEEDKDTLNGCGRNN